MFQPLYVGAPSFYRDELTMSLMLSRDFFLDRYEELGWRFRKPEVKQAIRVNTTNAEREEVIARLEAQGVRLNKISFLEDGYWIVKSRFSLGATPEYLLGLYSIQEAAAQIPATLFSQIENNRVLDACAAPGGKTVQLANLMKNTGVIVALDVKPRRLVALANHLERCHIKSTAVYQLDARKSSRLNVKFDRILLDVPCSGNFATDPGWFKRRTIKDVERHMRLQREIITEALQTLRDDGEIVYSTCSLEPEENEFNIDWAVKNLNVEVVPVDCFGEKAPTNIFGVELDDSIADCKRIWPGNTQGFFVCKFRRIS